MTSSESRSGPQPAPIRSIELLLVDEAASDALGQALAAMAIEGFTDASTSSITSHTSPTSHTSHTSRTSFDGFTIHLCGGLGAGKTTVVRALLRRLGVMGRIKSPTYTLVEPYVVELPKSVESRQHVNIYCYHFDFYRFEDPHEWLEAGFRDYFSDAALRLVEWPERARSDDGSLLPQPDLQIALEVDGDGRRAAVTAQTTRGAAWLKRAAFASPPRPRPAASVDDC